MNFFEEMLLSYFTKEQLDKIQKTRIVIMGCGGLGSNGAITLTRTGFKNFILIDHDKVEISNLNRQAYFFNQIGMPKAKALKENILKINPDCYIEEYVERITSENIESFMHKGDIIMEAVDSAQTKALILNTAIKLNKKVVSASGVCGYGNSEKIKIRRINNNVSIIGDFESDNSVFKPYAPKVIAISSLQCDEILRMVLYE
ncbi:sulfur carrier protein ThiS adenylyltransferase ThiF [Dictyoglomus thermophilum]|uniref:Thiamine biosynthesis protein ThiF n=2 Tax=Dictyoglomus thermophilum TaxID=14 RepID=B5YA96_DICT6|nr:sulfur carrier protein ThiS adenylyltransferase ThiF [Dictyoglomus thermophilum]ACI19346.1 thiamine biosynthesis protein ThiF [Dictyoglomus thermophilum H-6-12]MCX7720417.1 sulfur carrier protein ThiS adenylyltransferase ThiF [Dictyoglomus thermophilum]TYT24443.1 sulfur carrier protein ThiS adenylyltransferase ThiF [Dictyoglomus thermophilum]